MNSTSNHALQVLTDRCVRCGLCLPHCPTYLQSRQEGDGPRGRIALTEALARGELAPTPRLQQHLDGCLSCRACEAVCPAQVRFGELMDRGRALLAVQRPARVRAARLASALLRSRPRRRALSLLLRVSRRLGLVGLARHGVFGRRLARAGALLPPVLAATAPLLPPVAAESDVLLFCGCVTELAEREVLEDAARLLTVAGYRVGAPAAQDCCGALLQHAGDLERARRLARRNLATFGGTGMVAAITSGCAASLRDYAWLVPEGGASFAARVHDVGWLLQRRVERLHFKPLPLRAAVHLPCTLRNVVGEDRAMERLLCAVPEITLEPLQPAQRCCGAAGLQIVTDAAAADRLLAGKLAAVRQRSPDLILSSNIGCSLHLAAGLSRAGLTTPVMHPLRLLAQQLQPAG
ncbi:MAG: (Fe-S)-binding protein [Gammaproteobacteria bacterium]|nr:(Fe-S)-binding protein [Gammaproteobacteria bacterium]